MSTSTTTQQLHDDASGNLAELDSYTRALDTHRAACQLCTDEKLCRQGKIFANGIRRTTAAAKTNSDAAQERADARTLGTLDELKAAKAGTVVLVAWDADGEGAKLAPWTKNTDSDKGASRWTNSDGRWATSVQLAARIAAQRARWDAADELPRDVEELTRPGTSARRDLEAQQLAETMMRATGSTDATVRHERREADGSLTVTGTATAKRSPSAADVARTLDELAATSAPTEELSAALSAQERWDAQTVQTTEKSAQKRAQAFVCTRPECIHHSK